MIYTDFDRTMRQFEQSIDQVMIPDCYMVARIDGRSFTRLTKEICKFEAPFDIRFRDHMVDTVKALMDCGFRIVYGFTESDEISLLFHHEEQAFGRKIRKYNSILAGTASASFSLSLGRIGVFDCRMVPLPNVDRVIDYFLWRQEDANRNALNSHCYWMLRKEGISATEATEMLEDKTVGFKNELLFQRGINYNDLPLWQKRGIGLWFKKTPVKGFDPIRNCETETLRNRLYVEYELPLGAAYGDLIRDLASGVEDKGTGTEP